MKNFEEDLFYQSCENVKDFDRLVKFENEKRTCPLAEKEKGNRGTHYKHQKTDVTRVGRLKMTTAKIYANITRKYRLNQ